MPTSARDPSPSALPGDATARFYDGVAADYDRLLGGAADFGVRLSFCERVAHAAGPGGPILDFGCGTGTDAAWYAARGHHVLAYEVSPGMAERLRERCRGEMASGRVTLAVGGLEALWPALQAQGPVAAVSANFAVLNHVPELRPLFSQLAPHVAPGGALVANVLNPFYRRDMRQGWWWRAAWRSRGAGAIRHDGEVVTHRHFAGALRRAAGPDWLLEEVSAARPGRLLGALDSNFLFVTLRRQP